MNLNKFIDNIYVKDYQINHMYHMNQKKVWYKNLKLNVDMY